MKARLKLLEKTVISAIGKNPDIRLDELHLLFRVVASNNGLKWRGDL